MAPVVGSEDAERQWDAMFDWIEKNPQLDEDRVCAWGGSFGGYWATKVAHTHRERLKGMVSQGGGCHIIFTPDWIAKSQEGGIPWGQNETRGNSFGRPKFEEWRERVRQCIFMSATPGEYEIKNSTQVVEQIVRPTGLLDPEVHVRPTKGQIDDLLEEINKETALGNRVLVTTLTKKMAEDLTEYLVELGKRAAGRTVRDVMDPNFLAVDIDTPLFEVQRLMTEQDHWAVPVTESGLYRGVFTTDRFLHVYRQLAPDPLSALRMVDSRIADRRLIASGVSASDAKKYWFYGDFRRAFAYMENWPITVTQSPAGSEADFNSDVVVRFKASERGAAAVLNPRYVVKNTG